MGKYNDASKRTLSKSSAHFKDSYVYVDDSSFLRSQCNCDGKGLYANREFSKGEVIQEYKGIIISADAADKEQNNNYMFDVRKNKNIIHVIDASKPALSSAARYVNSTLRYNDIRRNAEFKQYNQRIYLVASKQILRHREIISFYGEDTETICSRKCD